MKKDCKLIRVLKKLINIFIICRANVIADDKKSIDTMSVDSW